ncbi:MAG: YciI family protein [Mycobacteriales bacterium]
MSLTCTAAVIVRQCRPVELSANAIKGGHSAGAAGALLASGRRVPRMGGVILVSGSLARDKLADPFAVAGVAEYDVVEFVPSRTAPGLEALTAS